MSQPRLTRLILWVKDPVLLSQWYRDTFGWQEIVNEAEAGWIELDANGFTLALHGGSHLKPHHWPKLQIAVDDVVAFRATMMNDGIPMGEIAEWKHMQWCECTDPEGNTVQICNRLKS